MKVASLITLFDELCQGNVITGGSSQVPLIEALVHPCPSFWLNYLASSFFLRLSVLPAPR